MEEKDFAAALHQSGYDFGKLTGTYGHYEDFKLQKPEVYRNTDMFKNQPEEEFNKWYKGIQEAYNEYENGRVANPTSISAGYALDDPISRTIGLATAPNMSVSFTPNKREYTKDFAGVEKAKYSMHEVAQKNTRYRDSRTGKMIENGDGIGGMLDFFSIGAKKGGLWLAHDENKNPVTDLYGNYYYETIEGKDTSGKEHLMLTFDNAITDEDSALNSLDFMDSDQIEQNVGRSLIKEGLKVASNFNPITRAMLAAGWVATTGMSLFGEAYKSISALGNAFSDGSFDPNKYKPSKEAEDIGNRVSNWGKMLTISSQTEEAQRDPFSMEGILNMIGSGATQIAGQRMLMEAPLFIKSVADPKFQKALQAGDKSAQRFLNVTKNAATAYMTAQSAQEVGEQFEAAGFDKGTKDIFMGIAAITLGAFYKASPFETWMLDKFDDKIAKSQVNKVLKETMDDFKKIYSPQTINAMSEPEKAAVAASFMTGVKKKLQGIGDFLGKGYGGNEIIKGTIGEGLEEPTEVIFGEVFKTAAQVMNKFNLLDEKDAKKYEALNPFGDDFFHEMAVSAVGGALAGGMTGIIDRVQNGKKNDRLETLSDIVQSGYTDTALQQIENLRKANIASGNLSAVYYDVSDGKRVYKTYNPNDPTDVSQADYIANSMAADIRKLKTAYEGIGATRDDLNKISQQFNRIAGDANLFQAASISSIVEDARAISRELVKVQLEKEKIAPLIPGKDNPGEDDKNKKLLAELTAKETQLLEKFNYYKSIGQDANPIIEDYLEEALFNKNYVLQNGFKVKNKIDFITNEDGSEKKGVDLKKGLEQWEEYRTTQRPKDLRDAFLEAKTKISKNGGDSYFRALYNVGDQESELKSRVKFKALDNELSQIIDQYSFIPDEKIKKQLLDRVGEILDTPNYVPDAKLLPKLDPVLNSGSDESLYKMYDYAPYKSKIDHINRLLLLNNTVKANPLIPVIYDEDGTLVKNITAYEVEVDNNGDVETESRNLSEKSTDKEVEDYINYIKTNFNNAYANLSNENKLKYAAIKKAFDENKVNSLEDVIQLLAETTGLSDHFKDVEKKLDLYNEITNKLSSLPSAVFSDRTIDDIDIQSKLETFVSREATEQSDFKGEELEKQLQELVDEIGKKKAALQIPGYTKPIMDKLKSINGKYFSGKKDTVDNMIPPLIKNEVLSIDDMYSKQLREAIRLLDLAKANSKVETKSLESQYVHGALKIINNIVARLGGKGYSIEDDELRALVNADEKTIAQAKNIGKLANQAYKELIKVGRLVKAEYAKANDNEPAKKEIKAAIYRLQDVSKDRVMDDVDALTDMIMVSMLRGDIKSFFENIHTIKQKSNKVPTFQQEMILFQAFSLYQYNESKFEEDAPVYPELETPGFNRALFINSNPGIGKTDILIPYLAELINNVSSSNNFVISSPKEGVVSGVLNKSLDSSLKKRVVGPDALNIGKVGTSVYPELKDKDAFSSDKSMIVPDFGLTAVHSKPPSRYIILDEATHLSDIDIKMLQASGDFVFMFGDSNQLGHDSKIDVGGTAPIDLQTVKFTPGIEKAPRITMSFRNKSQNYDTNSQTLLKLANILDTTSYAKINDVFNDLAKNNDLIFVYDPALNKGVKKHDEKAEDEMIQKALSEKASIIIVDDAMSGTNKDGVPIVKFEEVQGREYDYVIIRSLPDQTNPITKVQIVNTVLSRYKKAMLVPDGKLWINSTFKEGPVIDQLVMTPEKAASMKEISLKATDLENTGSVPSLLTGVPLPESKGGSSSTLAPSTPKAVIPTVSANKIIHYDETNEFSKVNFFMYLGETGKSNVAEINKVVKQMINSKSEKEFKSITLNGLPLSKALTLVEKGGLYYIEFNGEPFIRLADLKHFGNSDDIKKNLDDIINTKNGKFTDEQLMALFTNIGTLDKDPKTMLVPRRVGLKNLPGVDTADPKNNKNYRKYHESQGIYMTPPIIIVDNPLVVISKSDSTKTIKQLVVSKLTDHYKSGIPNNIQKLVTERFEYYEQLLGRTVTFVSLDEELTKFSEINLDDTTTLLENYIIQDLFSHIDEFKGEFATKRMTVLYNKSEKVALVDYLTQVNQVVTAINNYVEDTLKASGDNEIDENSIKLKDLDTSSVYFPKMMDYSDFRRIGLSLFEYVKEKLKDPNGINDPLVASIIQANEEIGTTYTGNPVAAAISTTIYKHGTKDEVLFEEGTFIPISQLLFGFTIVKNEDGDYVLREYYPTNKGDEKLTMAYKDIDPNSDDVPIILRPLNARTKILKESRLNALMQTDTSLDYTGDSNYVRLKILQKVKPSNDKYFNVNNALLLHELLSPLIESEGSIEDALSLLTLPSSKPGDPVTTLAEIDISQRVGIIYINKKKSGTPKTPIAAPDVNTVFDKDEQIQYSLAIPNGRVDKVFGVTPTKKTGALSGTPGGPSKPAMYTGHPIRLTPPVPPADTRISITTDDNVEIKGNPFTGTDTLVNLEFKNGEAIVNKTTFVKLDDVDSSGNNVSTYLQVDRDEITGAVTSVSVIKPDDLKLLIETYASSNKPDTNVTELAVSNPTLPPGVRVTPSVTDQPTVFEVEMDEALFDTSLDEQLGLWVSNFGEDDELENPRYTPDQIRNIIFGYNTDLEELVYDYMLNEMFGDIFLYNPRTGEMGLTHDKVKELNQLIAKNKLKITDETIELFKRVKGFVSSGSPVTDAITILKLIQNISPNEISNKDKELLAGFIAYNVGHHLLKGNVFSDLAKSVKVTTDGNKRLYYSMTNVVKEHSYLQESGNVDGVDGGSQFISSFLTRYEKIAPTVTYDSSGNATISLNDLTLPKKTFASKGDLLYGLDSLVEILNNLNADFDPDNIDSILNTAISLLNQADNNKEFVKYPDALTTLATLYMILGTESQTGPIYINNDPSKARYSINSMINKKDLSLNEVKALYQLRSALINTLRLKQVKPDLVENAITVKEKDRVFNKLSNIYYKKIDQDVTSDKIKKVFQGKITLVKNAFGEIEAALNLNAYGSDVKDAINVIPDLFKLIDVDFQNLSNVVLSKDQLAIIELAINQILNGESLISATKSQLANILASIKVQGDEPSRKKTSYKNINGDSTGIFSNLNLMLSNFYNKFAAAWNTLNNCNT